jgi:hypothetical protein
VSFRYSSAAISKMRGVTAGCMKKRKFKSSKSRRESWHRYYVNRLAGKKRFSTYVTPALMLRIIRFVDPDLLPETGVPSFAELQRAWDTYMQEDWIAARSDMFDVLDAAREQHDRASLSRLRSGDSILLPSVVWSATISVQVDALVVRLPTCRSADLQAGLRCWPWTHSTDSARFLPVCPADLCKQWAGGNDGPPHEKTKSADRAPRPRP